MKKGAIFLFNLEYDTDTLLLSGHTNHILNYNLIRGTLERRPNTAAGLTLEFHNDGHFSNWPTLGHNIKLYVGIDKLLDKCVFDGYIIDKKINASDATATITLIDYAGKLNDETITITDTSNYDGLSADTVIKTIIDSLNGTPLTFYSQGVYPAVTLPSGGIRADRSSKIAVINAILTRYCYDETDASNPISYRYNYDDGNFILRKDTNLNNYVAVKSYFFGADLFEASSEERSAIMCNWCFATDSSGNYLAEYSDTNSINQFGVIQKTVATPYDNSADAYSYAYRYVNRKKLPMRTLEVVVRDGFRVFPGDWVYISSLQDDVLGISGGHKVVDVSIEFAPKNVSTKLRLDNSVPYMTDYI